MSPTEQAVQGGVTRDETIMEGVVVRYFKSNNYTGTGDGFRLQKVFMKNRQVWWWGDEKFPGTTNELVEHEGENIVIRKKDDELLQVISLQDLASKTEINVAGNLRLIGGRTTVQALDFKLALAKELNLFLKPTKEESIILTERATAERKAKQEAENAKKAEQETLRQQQLADRRAKRQAKIDEIMAREKVVAWTESGFKMTGTPVTKSEWEVLPDDTPVILIGDDGMPKEAFKVAKTGTKAVKYRRNPVFVTNPVKGVADIQASDIITVTIKGVTRDDVPVYADMPEILELQKRGMNHGTWVAIPEARHPDKRLQVLAVQSNHIETVGVVERRSA